MIALLVTPTVFNLPQNSTIKGPQVALWSKKKKNKHLPASAGDPGDSSWTRGSGRSPREGNSNLLQCSCLENPMDRGAWWATTHGVAKSQTRLSRHLGVDLGLC